MAKRAAPPVGTPVRSAGDLWLVPGSGAEKTYVVRFTPTRRSCSCGAYLYGHGAPCKHLHAVAAAIAAEKGGSRGE